MLLALWVAQTGGGIDPTTQYTSLGVAGLICGVLTFVWLRAEGKLTKAEADIRELNRLRLEDRDKLLPLAGDMVRALGGATVALETKERRTLDDTLSGIEATLAELTRRNTS